MCNKRSKQLHLLSILIIGTFLFVSCGLAGLGDWEYEFPNNYEMWRVNARNIVIGYREPGSSVLRSSGIGVDAHVIAFCFNDQFVCAKRVTVGDADKPIDYDNPQFYIIDTMEQAVYGPFEDEERFSDELNHLDITGLGNWESTSPAPKGAIFPSFLSCN